MIPESYVSMVGYKKWADRGLYDVVSDTLGQLGGDDSANILRVLDHILTVDRIFRHHLQGTAHPFGAPRSDERPDLQTLRETSREVDDWYSDYVAGLSAEDFDEPIEFTFTSGKPARMTRGEIIMHVCLHGAYHRGQAGVVLLKNGIQPNEDRMTDFLELAA